MQRAHTEVLPSVAIRIPCLSSPAPLSDSEEDVNTDASDRQTVPTVRYASRPRLLPAPVLLLLTLFFVTLTALALGSTGVSSLLIRGTGWEHTTTAADASTLRPDMQEYLQREAARQKRQAAAIQAREAARASSSLIYWLPLIPLPPVHAVPFDWLLSHEYIGMFLWMFRAFVCRTLWHALVWWHVLCALAAMFELVRWRVRAGRQTVHGAREEGSCVLSLPLFVAHTLFWVVQSALFGWPAIFVLRQQLHAKSKRT